MLRSGARYVRAKFLRVKFSGFGDDLRKPRIFYSLKISSYTVYTCHYHALQLKHTLHLCTCALIRIIFEVPSILNWVFTLSVNLHVRWEIPCCVPCMCAVFRGNDFDLAMNIISNAKNATQDFSTQLKSAVSLVYSATLLSCVLWARLQYSWLRT